MPDIIEHGTDPVTGGAVTQRVGPYGPYIQLEIEGEKKPKRVSIPKNMNPDGFTAEQALALIQLPRALGTHPETKESIQAGIGRYGPFIKHGSSFVSIPAEDDVLSIGMNRAIELLSQKGGATKAGRELGNHPKDDSPIKVMDGRYGPYVKYKRMNVTIPKGTDPDTLTLDQALELIAAKAKKK